MMKFETAGWENGPTVKRDFKKPAKLKKDNILFIAFMGFKLILIVAWEIAVAFGSSLWRLIFRPEPKSLKGRVCLVTGAGRGLGRELCLALAREGAVIACVDINEPNNNMTATMVKELGAKSVPYTTNIAIKKDVEELVSKIEEELGPLYLLINNAALAYAKLQTDEAYIRASFNVNLFGPIWMMNAVLPNMELRNEGHIVNISSAASKLVTAPMDIYGATKIALSYFGHCTRIRLQLKNKENIAISTIYPIHFNSTEDYVNSITFTVNIWLEMEEVVRATMDAIHFNHEEVFVPFYSKLSFILTELVPSRATTNVTKLLCEKVNLPNEEQEKNLPWGDIIKKCSFIENTNGRN